MPAQRSAAVVAPPLIAVIIIYLNWRWVFVVTGAVGLLWMIWWASSTRSSGQGRVCAIEQKRQASPVENDANWVYDSQHAWIDLLKIRECWGLMSAKFLSDAAWYFYLFWLPKYLYDARNFDVKAVGSFAWIPYAAAGVGCLVGGWFSSYLVQREFSVDFAQKTGAGLERSR